MVRLRERAGVLCAALGLAFAPAALGAPAVEGQAGPAGQERADAPRKQPEGPERPAVLRRAELVKRACGEIAAAAKTFGLPQRFLTRLLWQESRFNPQAVSSAGALGIAQFMPGTAQWRGLDDPFDWSLSIQHSGRWLGELRQQFGNLGLAAAAYNAGPARVQGWLAGERGLPEETRAYVRVITGRDADDWVGKRDGEDDSQQPECPPRGAVAALAAPAGDSPLAPARARASAGPSRLARAWALQLAGDRSKSAVLQQYAEMRRQYPAILGPRAPEVAPRRIGGRAATFWYQVRVSEASRQSATTLCERLKSAGGQCLVIRN
jgi:hypothetical protein